MASNKRVTPGTANYTHTHGARDTRTHIRNGDIIARLHQVTSMPLPIREKASFKKNINELEEALKMGDHKTIFKHLEYFERTLHWLDGRDIYVKIAQTLVLQTREEFSDQTIGKTEVGVRGMKQNSNVQGHGMHVGNTQPSETPSFGEDALWLVNSIAKLKTCLTENKDLPQDAFEKRCPKALANAKADLDSIREEINRRVQTTRETHESFTKKLKELKESFKRPISEQVQEKERKATTYDPDAKLISDITDVYIGVAKKAERYSQDLSELHQTLNKPLDVQLDMKLKRTPPVDSYEKVMLAILDLFIEKSKRENETLEKFDKETKGKSVKNEQNSMDPLRKEIEQLLKEIEETNINNKDYKKRTKNYKPTDTFLNLDKVRIIIADRTAEVEKMKIAVKDLKRHVEEKKFPPEKKRMDTEWETCIADVLGVYRSALQSNDRYQNENAELRTRISNLQSEIESIQKVAKSLGAEKEDLVLRLSSIAGAKLTGINTTIADLSDPNRPTKLAERYREVFDTEWTDAYEELEKSVHGQCIDIAKRQKKNIYNYLLNPTATTTHTESDTVLDTALTKTITDLRIPTARMSVKNVIKGLQPNDDSLGSILKYRNKCVEICWYMSLQSPPMVLERLNTTQAQFDKDRYSEFTKKGSKVDFVTWPPMLLHEGGPLMCKGVAQGK